MKIKFFYLIIIIISMIASTSCANINTISPVMIYSQSSRNYISNKSNSSSSTSPIISQQNNSSSSKQLVNSNITAVSSTVQYSKSSSAHSYVTSSSNVSFVKKTDWSVSGPVPSPVDIPNLDGKTVSNNDRASVDLSYTSYGFIKVNLVTPSQSRIKVIIQHENNKYTYDLKNDDSYEIFPLQMGDGNYTISVYENISNSQYAQIFSTTAQVSLSQSYAPFLVPSQFVSYSKNSNVVALAKQLVNGKTNNYDCISAVLTYIARNISYDYALAKNVTNGYIPSVDQVLARRKGICFDYAAVSAAMLRSLGYPTKLVVGYVAPGNIYHAWNEVYIQGQGWVKVMSVTVNAKDWTRVDVTFISSSNSPSSIEKFVGNANNYTNKYIY